jgi:hypothetical protein
MNRHCIQIGILFALIALATLGLTCAQEQSKDSSAIYNGRLVGVVINNDDGAKITDASIKALYNDGAKGWRETSTDADGLFVLDEVPASSDVLLELNKTGFCPMHTAVKTPDAENGRQLTDVVIRAIPQNAKLQVVVSAMGQFLKNITVILEPTSYSYLPVTAKTDDAGTAVFNVGLMQAYHVLIAPVQLALGDDQINFSAATAEVTIGEPTTTHFLDLQEIPPGAMTLISEGVDGASVIALFSERIYHFELVAGGTDGAATFKDPPANVGFSGNQVTLSPILTNKSKPIHVGDLIFFTVRAQGRTSGTWWQGTIEYFAGGEPTGDDDDTSADDDTSTDDDTSIDDDTATDDDTTPA